MVQIRSIEDVRDLRQCVRIQESTWGPDFQERVPVTMLQLCLRLGGYAAGAFEGDEMVGFVFGLPGIVGGELIHWSDMLAVLPDWRGRGIGLSLKRHQREALLERGVTRVCWTFEPLEARNGYLNIARLGATAHEYVRDFYRASDSPLHQGIGTDRLIAVWDIASKRVEDRLSRRGPSDRPPDLDRAPIANRVPGADTAGGNAAMLSGAPRSAVRIAVPTDIQRIKQKAPALAAEWRDSTRTAFEALFAHGYMAEDFVRAEREGWYLLRSPQPTDEKSETDGSLPRAARYSS